MKIQFSDFVQEDVRMTLYKTLLKITALGPRVQIKPVSQLLQGSVIIPLWYVKHWRKVVFLRPHVT